MCILITRPSAEKTARFYKDQGCEVLAAPVLSIVPVDFPCPSGRFDGLIMTSIQAFSGFERLDQRFKSIPAFVIGLSRQKALERIGFTDVIEAGSNGTSLAGTCLDHLAQGSHLLHICGVHTKLEPEYTLINNGLIYHKWPVYDAVETTDLPREVKNAFYNRQIDVVLHYSRRSAQVFLKLVTQSGIGELAQQPIHVCLSQDVAQVFYERSGFKAVASSEPSEKSIQELVMTLLKA